jgi:hypothetical protein
MPGKLQKPRRNKLGGNNDKSSSEHISKIPEFIYDKIELLNVRGEHLKWRYTWNK